MRFRTFDIEGPLLIEPKRRHDIRGFFCETYDAQKLAKQGIEVGFVQDNLSLSTAGGSVRGLHFQGPPFAQHRLIRVVRGAIFDVAVDARHGSPTYGKHVSAELSAENGFQMYVPAGFAHGFATLRPLTEIACKISAPYAPEHEIGIFWDDPALRIPWPVSAGEALLSPEDEALPLLREIKTPFRYASTEDDVAA